MRYESFGKWLKHQRRMRGMTRAALGEAVGIKGSYISKIENGHVGTPEEETRARFHMALGTSEDDLVAAGILERIESPFSDRPIYIAASSIPALARQESSGSGTARVRDVIRSDASLTTDQVTAVLTVLEAFWAVNEGRAM